MGHCAINGNGHSINVANGEMIVASASDLTLFSVKLSSISGSKIRCQDDTSKLILQDAMWTQDGSTTFTSGALLFMNKVTMGGNATFAYQSSQTSTVLAESILQLDEDFTFSYDPIVVASKQLFAFEDETSVLCLNGGSLHATTTGLVLTNGCLFVQENSFISSEVVQTDVFNYDQGITFGDEIAGHALILAKQPS